MEFSEFTFRLILLFLPGVISYLIIENLVVIERRSVFYFSIYSFILGFLSYLLYNSILTVFIWIMGSRMLSNDLSFFGSLTDSDKSIEFQEVFFVSLLSVGVGLSLSAFFHRKLFHRAAKRLKITNRFGDIGVWGYLFNSSGSTEWVVVRDIKFDLLYEGWVEAFSDTVKDNELFLRDVVVYRNSTGEELYRVPGQYITRKWDELSIEFPKLEYSEYIEREHE